MAKLINIGFGNVVNSQKIVAVGKPGCRSGETNGSECEGFQFPCGCHSGKKDQVRDRYFRPHSDIICDPAGHDRPQICRSYRK